jgi:hypothetical protein
MDIQCPNCNSIEVYGWSDEMLDCRKCGYRFFWSEIDEFSSGDPDGWYELEDAQ